MKVSTNLTSGNMMDLARQAETALVDQAGSFFYAAEQQAAGLTSTVANMAYKLWQGLTG
jgi:hypothetical protein